MIRDDDPVTMARCSCGHAVDRHDATGCHDGSATNVCACRLSRVEATDAVVPTRGNVPIGRGVRSSTSTRAR